MRRTLGKALRLARVYGYCSRACSFFYRVRSRLTPMGQKVVKREKVPDRPLSRITATRVAILHSCRLKLQVILLNLHKTRHCFAAKYVEIVLTQTLSGKDLGRKVGHE